MSDYSDTHWMKDLPNKPFIENKLGPPKDMSELELLGHQAEHWRIEKFTLLNVLDSLAAGLDHAQTALAEHDVNYGRTTRKNKPWAETLESDIRNIKKSIKDLKTIVAAHNTHYP